MLREDRQVAVTWSVEQVVHTGRRTQIKIMHLLLHKFHIRAQNAFALGNDHCLLLITSRTSFHSFLPFQYATQANT